MNTGFRLISLHDGVEPLSAAVFYPASQPESTREFGGYPIQAAHDAPSEATQDLAVVISHGTGGSPFTHRGLAAHLAQHGYLVILPEHPRNNRNDNALAGTAEILANRPRHLRAALDWSGKTAAALIGHSLGGYTALALAGGQPASFPNESPDGVARPVPVEHDARVAKLILLAPAAAWFLRPGSLAGVQVPVLTLTAERDSAVPGHAEILQAELPHMEHRVIPNAGHFSFLTPFPPHRVSPSLPPSQDPPGFDRAAFQQEMKAEILRFLQATPHRSGA